MEIRGAALVFIFCTVFPRMPGVEINDGDKGRALIKTSGPHTIASPIIPHHPPSSLFRPSKMREGPEVPLIPRTLSEKRGLAGPIYPAMKFIVADRCLRGDKPMDGVRIETHICAVFLFDPCKIFGSEDRARELGISSTFSKTPPPIMVLLYIYNSNWVCSFIVIHCL